MGLSASQVCDDAYSSYPASSYLPGVFGNVGIGGMVIGFIYVCSSAVTIAWIRKQQHNALMGMEGAAKHVIFPIYLPIMWVSAFSDASVALVIFFVEVNTTNSSTWTAASLTAAALGVQHCVIEGIAVILMQYGCGMKAMQMAALRGGLFGLLAFSVCLFFYKSGSDSPGAVIAYFAWLVVLLLFYGTLWLTPQQKLYRRPAIIYYARFWALLVLLEIFAITMEAVGHSVVPYAGAAGLCIDNLAVLPAFVLFKPYVMYSTLLMESQWWQGVLTRSSDQSDVAPRRGQRGRNSSSRALHRGGGGNGGGGGGGGGRHKSTGRSPVRYIRSIDDELDKLVDSRSTSMAAGGAGADADADAAGAGAGAGGSSPMRMPVPTLTPVAENPSNGEMSGSSHSDYYSNASEGREGAGGGLLSSAVGAVRSAFWTVGYFLGFGGRGGRSTGGSGSNSSLGDRGGDEGGGGGGGGSAGRVYRDRDLSLASDDDAETNRTSGSSRGGGGGRRAGTGRAHQRNLFGVGLRGSGGKGTDKGNYDQLKGPLLGVEVGFSEAQELAQEVDNIRTEGTVRLLNFAYLSLDKRGKKLLGSGSFSKVYAGKYRNKPVAVKMLFTQDLNPDVIRRCSNEARILTEVSPHPNVVHIFGVAVLPPRFDLFAILKVYCELNFCGGFKIIPFFMCKILLLRFFFAFKFRIVCVCFGP
jgi:hypothetical protein